MNVSVVVPTFRRPDALAKCLEALRAQQVGPHEVLVVVRTDDEATAPVIAASDLPVQAVPVDVPPGRPGFVAGLNAGLEASTGQIVCFTDDDTEPRPDWLSRIVAGFEADSQLGALGGRDWVHHGEVLDDGAEAVVGVIDRWGRTIGNHHLGFGEAREVEVLKGANLSVRGDLARSIGFDTRLLGITTEHHSELHLCLAIKRRGFRIVYDPAIAVDHRPAPRMAGEDRSYGPRQLHHSSHNETLAVLEHVRPRRRLVHLAFATLLGSRGAPGLIQSVRLGITTGDPRLDLLRANLAGRRRALRTWRKTGVLSIAGSENARRRAEQLLDGVPEVEVLAPSGVRGLATGLLAAATSRARTLYLVDVDKATAIAAPIGRLRRRRVILDTGDAVFELARSLGDRSFPGLFLVGLGESVALRSADHVVVRGRLHADLVPTATTHIPDLAPIGAGPVDAGELRRSLGLEDSYVVGLVGSLILSERLGVSYGWDLVEALAFTDPRVKALIVGDGSGRQELEARAAELGVADRSRFVGTVSPDRVSAYVCAMQAAISTQTDDVVGRVRTTGKLPLYLACGRPVIATDVGEAKRLLGPHGWTIPFRGRLDRDYPRRLGERIEAWRSDPEAEEERRRLASKIAAAEFDPTVMKGRLQALLATGGGEGPR